MIMIKQITIDHSLGVRFHFGLILVSFSIYFFIASSLLILPSLCQASHLYLSTTFNLLGAFVLFSPSVACLNRA